MISIILKFVYGKLPLEHIVVMFTINIIRQRLTNIKIVFRVFINVIILYIVQTLDKIRKYVLYFI